MKNLNVFTGIIFVFTTFLSAEAYRPAFPKGPYYFHSENHEYLVEVTPTINRSRDSKYLLVKKSQALSLYRKGDNNSWQEINSFRVAGMHLIKEVLIPDDGKVVVVRIDENPMVSNVNKDDGIFVFSTDGEKIKSYSHLSVFGSPGIFRDMKLSLDNKGNELVISGKKNIKKIVLPK